MGRDGAALVVVTGPPASGKTSIAERLAAELGLPVVAKDALKETLYDVLGSGEGVEETLDDAALALLYRVVRMQLEAGVAVMAEANFDARSDVGPLRALHDRHAARLVQVHVSAPTDELVARFAERAASGDRHPGHEDRPEDVAELRAKIEAGLWEPLDLPGELVCAEADDADAVVARVRRLLPGESEDRPRDRLG